MAIGYRVALGNPLAIDSVCGACPPYESLANGANDPQLVVSLLQCLYSFSHPLF